VRAVPPVSMAEGGGGVLCWCGVSRHLGLGRSQCLVVAVVGGVSSPGEMVCYVLVPRRRWVASFGTERKLCPAPIVVGDVDTLCIDFLPEGIIGVI
jgi:hypothetical protein